MDINPVKDISSLAATYERTKEEHNYLLGTNHVIKWMSKWV